MIQKISLQNFRNFSGGLFEFDPDVTLITGPNASGKSNLLESVFLLATGKSFKASLESDLIGKGKDFARVKGLVDGVKLEVLILKVKTEDGARMSGRKKYMVDGVSKRLVDFVGNLKAVLFAPSDLDLVTSSPSLRRNFLDNTLSQVDRNYRRALSSYERGLRQRNKLLLDIREGRGARNQLFFWDQLLIRNADYISGLRNQFVNFINSWNFGNLGFDFRLSLHPSVISPARLERYAREEVAAGKTLVGPHRDDFDFMDGERDLADFGSRGEQRMAVLWLKLAELGYIERRTGQRPVLLLDDIFSELDLPHKTLVRELVKNQQTIITTADTIDLGFDHAREIKL